MSKPQTLQRTKIDRNKDVLDKKAKNIIEIKKFKTVEIASTLQLT